MTFTTPRLAWRTLRSRGATLSGTFLALALGVALIAAMCSGLAATFAAGGLDEETRVTLNALLGTTAGVTTFVAVFVVASTYSYAVAQRRREFGLLRLAGSTRAQVRRLVLSEALALGVLASGTGCVLGAYGAPLLTDWLIAQELAPPGFAPAEADWPYHVAFWTGLSLALTGAYAAAWRAGRVTAIEALREADVDTGTMPLGRLLLGGALGLLGLGLLCWRIAADPGEALHRKTYTVQPMLLITACGLLAPLLVRPLVRGLGRLLPGVWGRIVSKSAWSGLRRTAALAAPVLVTVALAGSLLGTTATIAAAKSAEAREQTRADFVVQGAAPALPGTWTSPTAPTSLATVEDGTSLIDFEARATHDPAGLAATTALPVLAGRLSGLDDRSIVVTQEWQQHQVGKPLRIRLADGTWRTLRIAAVLRTGTGSNSAYVTARNAPGATVDRTDVRLRPGTDRTAAQASLGPRALPAADWLATTYPSTSRQTRLGFTVVLGIALLYALIALANTAVLATADRRRALTLLRLAGATKAQVLRSVATEALLVVAVGTVLGAAVTAANLAGISGALAALGVAAPPAVPWGTLAATAGACAAVAVAASVTPAWLVLQGRPG